MTVETSICAKYKTVDGWHIFESDDLPGLYIASKDAERAYNDIGPAIEKLIRLDEGLAVKVSAEKSYREFLNAVKQDDGVTETALVLSDKRFVVAGAVA